VVASQYRLNLGACAEAGPDELFFRSFLWLDGKLGIMGPGVMGSFIIKKKPAKLAEICLCGSGRVTRKI